MGVISWVAERFGLQQPHKNTIAKFIERGLANQPLPHVFDLKRFADQGYRRNVLIYACVKLRMQSAAQVKYIAKRRNANGDLDPLPDEHPLQMLLLKPNAEQSQQEWVEQAFLHYDVGGNAYVHKVRPGARGAPVELWNLRPDKVAIIPEPNGFIKAYQFPVDDFGQARDVEPRDVVHFKDYDFLNDYYGISKIAVLAMQGDIDTEAAGYMRSVFLNSGMPAGGLKIKSEVPIAKESKEALASEWRDSFGRNQVGHVDRHGWGRIAIFDSDVEWIKMGQLFNELNLDGIFQHTETRICAAFGVPPNLIGAKAGLDRNTYSNAEQAEDHYWNNVMVPDTKRFANKLTSELAPEFGPGIVIDPDYTDVRALQEDQDAKAKRAKDGWAEGVVQFDEYRACLGFEPVGEETRVDDDTGEETTGLGKRYKWELPSNQPAQLEGDEEEDDEEEEDEEREEQRKYPKEALSRNAPWRRLHDAADEKSLSIRRGVSKALRTAQGAVPVQALQNALFMKDSMAAEELALGAFRKETVPLLKKAMVRPLSFLYLAGTRVGGRQAIKKQGTWPKEKLATIPPINPQEDEQFAETRVAELVTDITEATRELIRRTIEGIFGDGFSARRAATKIRDTLGLTKQGLRRLEKFEEEMRKRGKSGDELESALARFTRKLIRERALVIARTESIRAVSEGQSSIWDKAVKEGILPQDQMQFWITVEDERVCPICAPMDGQERKIGETFSTGLGGSVLAPPAHPNCRCARGLR